jgi:hypothetical protein
MSELMNALLLEPPELQRISCEHVCSCFFRRAIDVHRDFHLQQPPRSAMVTAVRITGHFAPRLRSQDDPGEEGRARGVDSYQQGCNNLN